MNLNGDKWNRTFLCSNGEVRDARAIDSSDLWYFDSRGEAEEQLAVLLLKQEGE